MRVSLKKLLLEDFKPKSYKELVDKAASASRVQVQAGSGRSAKANPSRDWIEEHLDSMLMLLFYDSDFYYNYAPEEYANDYKRAIRDVFLPYVKKNFKMLQKLLEVEETSRGLEIGTKYNRDYKEKQKLMIAAFNKIKNKVPKDLVDVWKEYHQHRFGMNI